ncbi:hypothetical protein CDAR_586951 [Caerostris darwini]|uniref:Uncharacterized protein n=1 Tax=Caerostris darwini TaxID=1538125 RepID=A0AAV4U1C5_9ARAC|nr:hypothetical protein CDAR_586951 [Caerostris darwini]
MQFHNARMMLRSRSTSAANHRSIVVLWLGSPLMNLIFSVFLDLGVSIDRFSDGHSRKRKWVLADAGDALFYMSKHSNDAAITINKCNESSIYFCLGLGSPLMNLIFSVFLVLGVYIDRFSDGHSRKRKWVLADAGNALFYMSKHSVFF